MEMVRGENVVVMTFSRPAVSYNAIVLFVINASVTLSLGSGPRRAHARGPPTPDGTSVHRIRWKHGL